MKPALEHIEAIEQKQITLKHWLILLLLSIIWGSSYILMKKALLTYEPTQVACLRISISGLAFLPFFMQHWKRVAWSKLKFIILVGLAGSGIPAFLFAVAQTEINSSITGVLSSLSPLFTLLLGIILFKFPVIWSKILGVILGLSGAAFLILFSKKAGLDGNAWYGLLVVLGTLLYALSANIVQAYLNEVDVITISAISFFLLGIPAVIYLSSTNFLEVLQTKEQAYQALAYIAILSLFGTVLASILFYRLVQMTSAVFSSMVSYLVPMVAILLGSLDHEPITIFHFIGMLLILSGVYISRK